MFSITKHVITVKISCVNYHIPYIKIMEKTDKSFFFGENSKNPLDKLSTLC